MLRPDPSALATARLSFMLLDGKRFALSVSPILVVGGHHESHRLPSSALSFYTLSSRLLLVGIQRRISHFGKQGQRFSKFMNV